MSEVEGHIPQSESSAGQEALNRNLPTGERLTQTMQYLKETFTKLAGHTIHKLSEFVEYIQYRFRNIDLRRLVPAEDGTITFNTNKIILPLLAGGFLGLLGLLFVKSINLPPPNATPLPSRTPQAQAQAGGVNTTPTILPTPTPEIKLGNFTFNLEDTERGFEIWDETGSYVLCYYTYPDATQFNGSTLLKTGNGFGFLKTTLGTLEAKGGWPIALNCPTDPYLPVTVLVEIPSGLYPTLERIN